MCVWGWVILPGPLCHLPPAEKARPHSHTQITYTHESPTYHTQKAPSWENGTRNKLFKPCYVHLLAMFGKAGFTFIIAQMGNKKFKQIILA